MTDMPSLEPCPIGPARITRTHFELRCLQNGQPTPLRERQDTLNLARASATTLARSLGFENFFELEPGESFTNEALADGVYLTTVRTETVARAI
jgi:hypothetical protein